MKKTYSSKIFILSFIAFCIIFVIIASLFTFLSGNIFFSVSSYNEETILPTVIIDAGHGGEDGGTVGVNGALEKDLNLILAKKLAEYLEALGVRVVLTRSEDILLYDRNADYMGHKKLLDAKERLRITEAHENAIFVSIHQNAFTDGKYSGAQIYYSPNALQSKQLALTIENAIRSSLQPENKRAAKPSSGRIYLLDRLECPAVLVECGFLSNNNECELLCNEEYQNRLCAVLASAIFEYISVK